MMHTNLYAPNEHPALWIVSHSRDLVVATKHYTQIYLYTHTYEYKLACKLGKKRTKKKNTKRQHNSIKLMTESS